jgi:hypothetical protein
VRSPGTDTSAVPERFSGGGARSELPRLQTLTRPLQLNRAPPNSFSGIGVAAVMSAKRPRALTDGVDPSGSGSNSRVHQPSQASTNTYANTV